MRASCIREWQDFTLLRRQLIVDLAPQYRLPAIYAFREFVQAGVLMRYGETQLTDQFRQAGFYVDRILKSEKPDDLPIQQPNKYALSINLKAARALGMMPRARRRSSDARHCYRMHAMRQ